MTHIDLAIAAEEMVKAAGWKVTNSHTSASGSFYFSAMKMDADGNEVEDARGEVIDFTIRVSNHPQQSCHMGNLGGVSVNIFNEFGLEDLAERLAK